MMIMRNSILVVWLIYLSIQDIRFHSVALNTLIFAYLAAIIYRLAFFPFTSQAFIFLLLFILGMTIIGGITGCIGLGDTAVLGLISCVMGSFFMIKVLIGSVLLMVLSIFMHFILKKTICKISLPFIPYIFVSVLGVLVCG